MPPKRTPDAGDTVSGIGPERHSRLPYPIRLGEVQRREWQRAADASGRTLAGWIKWTCDREVAQVRNYMPRDL